MIRSIILTGCLAAFGAGEAAQNYLNQPDCPTTALQQCRVEQPDLPREEGGNSVGFINVTGTSTTTVTTTGGTVSSVGSVTIA